jgi:TATA-binding protein-associated factor
MRHLASSIVSNICQVGHAQAIKTLLPLLLQNMTNIEDDACRLGACQLLKSIVDATGIAICPFVPNLLPVTMSMLIDPAHECARVAASLFSSLVRVAPLVCESDISVQGKQDNNNVADKVIHHLIHGKPLPPCTLPNRLVDALKKSGTTLRDYQLEGIAWMRFLHSVHLNGALCDDLGLGKTLMALTAVAMAHCDSLNNDTDKALTLVVCPSTLVAHWVNEINRFFPRNDNDNLSIFRVINYSGPAKARKGLWDRNMKNGSIVITSYSILRSDIDLLAKTPWLYCILDEGHLLKNPRTGELRNHFELQPTIVKLT